MKISIDGIQPRKQLFHLEPIDVYQKTVSFEEIEDWRGNARTLLAFRIFEQQRKKANPGAPPPTLEEVTEFLAADPELKLEPLAESIARNGVRVPLILTRNGTLLDGNRRYFACSLLKMQEVEAKRKPPTILSAIPAWVIKDSDLDERKKKKILAEVNFVDDLRVKWPISVQARIVADYYRQCISEKKSEDQAYENIYDLYGVRSDKARSYVEAQKLADEFMGNTSDTDQQLRLEKIVQKRFVYFWEFVNKGLGGAGKLSSTNLPKAKRLFFQCMQLGRIKKLKQIEPLIHAVKDEFQWKELTDSKGGKLPAVEIWYNSRKAGQTAEYKLREFLTWLEKEFSPATAPPETLDLVRKISARCEKIMKEHRE